MFSHPGWQDETISAALLSTLSKELMLEEGRLVPANPSCKLLLLEIGLWARHGHWTAEKGDYLTDILSEEENTFIKDILMVINPKNGTDFWAGRRCDGGRSPLDYQRSYSTTSTRELRKETLLLHELWQRLCVGYKNKETRMTGTSDIFVKSLFVWKFEAINISPYCEINSHNSIL